MFINCFTSVNTNIDFAKIRIISQFTTINLLNVTFVIID